MRNSIQNLEPFSLPHRIGVVGFTLLELVISVSIIGIIILLVGNAMRLGFRSVDSGEKKIQSLERIRASLKTIDSQIQSSIPFIAEESESLFYFKGEKGFLKFPTNYSVFGGQRGYVVATYRVASDDYRRKSLYLSENVSDIKEEKETKLLDGFDEIYFEYHHRNLLTGEEKWIEDWIDISSIPEKIRLTLVQGTKSFSFIIPLRARSPK